MHRRLKGGSMTLLLVTPGIPASGEPYMHTLCPAQPVCMHHTLRNSHWILPN